MTRKLSLCAFLVLVAACSAAGGGGGSASKADLSTDEAKTRYALGFTIGTNVSRGKPFTGDEAGAISDGLGDALAGRPAQVEMQTFGAKVQQMMMARAGQGAPPPGQQPPAPADPAKLAAEKAKGTDYADKAAKEPGAEKLASGLVFKSITPGTGASPTATDVVKVNYEGKLIDGTVFDASSKHGGSATFPLNHVIPCWTEGVQKLKVGGKAELVCPSTIAYGDMGHPPTIPGGSTLVFTVELLDINAAPPAGAPGAPGAPGGPHMNMNMQQMKGPNGQPGAIRITPPPPAPGAAAPAKQ